MSALSLRRLLFLSLRVGNSTFGGGEPTMAVFQRELVGRRGWLSPEQYGLAYGLARVTPGTNVLAFCAAAGWQLLKWPGALAVVLGLAGFARREDRRTCAVAAVLGLAALPWQLALAVALAVLFFAASAAMLRGRT